MVRRLGSLAEVLAAAAGDPFTRVSWVEEREWLVAATSPSPAGGATGWLALDNEGLDPVFEVVGDPAAAAEVVAAVWDELPVVDGRREVTVPRGTPALLPAHGLRVGHEVDWEFRWTTGLPRPLPAGSQRVGWLPKAADGEVEALLRAWSPTASAHPGDDHVLRWAGARDGADGGLAAVAADTSTAPGAGLVSSVAVRGDLRRSGLGAAVVGWTTAALLRDPGREIVGLGHYASNAAGRGLYDRLGFEGGRLFTSGPVRRT